MIILPDIHGRQFWQEAKQRIETDELIFLGDYLDPYGYEGIRPLDAIDNLLEIIELKKAYPEKVTLLIGNHDLMTYVSPEMGSCRTDFANLKRISKIFDDNHDLFEMAAVRKIDGKNYVFSHAGILRGWAAETMVKKILGVEETDVEGIVGSLNRLWKERDERLFEILTFIGFERGGDDEFGSPVWADIHEWSDRHPEFEGYYQIFGHTQSPDAPYVRDTYADLDCRKAFELKEGELIVLK